MLDGILVKKGCGTEVEGYFVASHFSRLSMNGGGIAILARDELSCHEKVNANVTTCDQIF